MQVGDRDLLNPNIMRDDMHDWVAENEGKPRGVCPARNAPRG